MHLYPTACCRTIRDNDNEHGGGRVYRTCAYTSFGLTDNFAAVVLDIDPIMSGFSLKARSTLLRFPLSFEQKKEKKKNWLERYRLILKDSCSAPFPSVP